LLRDGGAGKKGKQEKKMVPFRGKRKGAIHFLKGGWVTKRDPLESGEQKRPREKPLKIEVT